jgi:hypothetical protein
LDGVEKSDEENPDFGVLVKKSWLFVIDGRLSFSGNGGGLFPFCNPSEVDLVLNFTILQ